jgi:hypothetical protein
MIGSVLGLDELVEDQRLDLGCPTLVANALIHQGAGRLPHR